MKGFWFGAWGMGFRVYRVEGRCTVHRVLRNSCMSRCRLEPTYMLSAKNQILWCFLVDAGKRRLNLQGVLGI